MDQFKGIFPALITPMHPSGEVDENALEAIVRLHLSQGVKGFYILGSTAECHLLTTQERMRIAQIVRELTRDKAVVIGHVGSVSTQVSAALARHAAEIGLDAISAVPPFYYKYGFEEIYGHYQEIMAQCDLPMIVYNIPALSGVRFTQQEYLRFAENPRIIGVKYTDHELYALANLHMNVPGFILYNGYDEDLLGGLAMGAQGAIGTTYNFQFARAQAICDNLRAGAMDKALELQCQSNAIINVLSEVGIFQGAKYLMRKYGIDCGDCRMPMKKLTAQDKQRLDAIMDLI